MRPPPELSYGRGVASLASASVFIAAANVVFGSVVQDVTPIALTLIAFTIAAVVFALLNRGRRPPLDPESWRNIVGLNFASAGVFIFLYTGLKYLEPAIASALQAGATPLFTILVLSLIARRWVAGPAEWTGGLVIVAGSALLAWVSLAGRSGLRTEDTLRSGLGIAAVLASGLSTVFLTLCVKRLTQLGWPNLTVLAHRFYVTVVGCALLTLGVETDWGAVRAKSAYIVSFSVLGVALPLLLLQVGIRNVAPFVVLAMTNLNPILTYVIQLADSRLVVSLYTLAGVVVVLAGVLWVIWSQSKATRPAPAWRPAPTLRASDPGP
jgi:drug/metabolite transporter (DMT)-like permease